MKIVAFIKPNLCAVLFLIYALWSGLTYYMEYRWSFDLRLFKQSGLYPLNTLITFPGVLFIMVIGNFVMGLAISLWGLKWFANVIVIGLHLFFFTMIGYSIDNLGKPKNKRKMASSVKNRKIFILMLVVVVCLIAWACIRSFVIQSNIDNRETTCIAKYKSWNLKKVLNSWDEMNGYGPENLNKKRTLDDLCAATVTRSRVSEMYSALENNESFSFDEFAKIIVNASMNKDARFCPYYVEFLKLRMKRGDNSVNIRLINSCGENKVLAAISELERYMKDNELEDKYSNDVEFFKQRILSKNK